MQFQNLVLMVLVFFSMLVSGYKENTMPLSVPNNVEQNQQEHEDDMNKRPQQQQQQQQQRLRHSFEAFFSSKRKVPNASDPLHNR
ncbi:hypothetical protein PRUPE_1G428300 [Prunus persica]|uniref:Uncharacterized protein n=1 Tax=Prunus persica TaxID=3760 RepID=A0A251RBY6_PRUPE|nr:hypothetical protein PRUPE_1G428300 [Prunus persica]